jgi:hypothetical protein
MHEPGVPDLLVIFRRHYPAGTAHIGGAEQDRKIEKRLLEVEAHCVVADNLHTLGVVVEDMLETTSAVQWIGNSGLEPVQLFLWRDLRCQDTHVARAAGLVYVPHLSSYRASSSIGAQRPGSIVFGGTPLNPGNPYNN